MTDFKSIGRYEIRKELGRGGMATVFLAFDPQFKREVAVKMLPREFSHDPQFRERFSREAQTIAGLEHSGIVPVYDYGEEEGQAYLVMRFMPGGTLADKIENGALPPDECYEIVNRIGMALDAAHKSGIIHRDIKPGNVLFDQHGDAYISDFGLVRMQEGDSKLTGSTIVGTPAYMAPELSQMGGLTHLVDIYALGVTLYQMVIGDLPYHADTPLGLMLAHAVEPMPDVETLRPDLPAEIQFVVRRSMSKDPTLRYQTAKAMADDLKAAISGTPLQSVTGYSGKDGGNRFATDTMNFKRSSQDRPTNPFGALTSARSAGASIPTWAYAVAGVAVTAVLIVGGIALLGGNNGGSGSGDGTSAGGEGDEPGAAADGPGEEPTETPQSTATEEPTATPLPDTFGAGGDFIAFQSNQDGDFEIYLSTVDGFDQIKLTEDPASDTLPTWSPDGTFLVFASARDGNVDVYSIRPDGSGLRRLTSDPANDFNPVVSPDGAKIAFVSNRDGNNEIYVMNADGSGEQRLTENRNTDLSPVWSPDGRLIAFSSNPEGQSNIFIMTASGTLREQVTNDPRDDVAPAWSPDGTKMAFASNRDGDWDIYVVDLESDEVTLLTDNRTYDNAPQWSPDGQYIVFAAGDQFRMNQTIYIMKADGSEREALVLASASYYADSPSWQPFPAGDE